MNKNKKKWRKSPVLRRAFNVAKDRDGHCCQICGEQINLTVHHLYAGSKFEVLRTDLENLVTLCNNCHVDYHRIFNGVYNNKVITPDTFLIFLRMNEYHHDSEGNLVRNPLVTELIQEVQRRLPYLVTIANGEKCLQAN